MEEKIIPVRFQNKTYNMHSIKSTGRGLPIVYLHGLMDSSYSWEPVFKSLSRPGIAIDLPGFGSSDLFKGSYAEWVELVSRTINKLGIERFHLVGHSLGGAIAAGIADLYPARVVSLTLIAPAGFGPIPALKLLNRALISQATARALPFALSWKPIIELSYKRLFSHHKNIDALLLERLLENRHRLVPGSQAGLKVLGELTSHHLNKTNFKGPTGIIWGEHDHLTPIRGLELAHQVYPQAEIFRYDDVGHDPVHEIPEMVSANIALVSKSNFTPENPKELLLKPKGVIVPVNG